MSPDQLQTLWNAPELMDCLRTLPTVADRSLDPLLAAFARLCRSGRRRELDVLEVACGSGRLSLELLRRHPGRVRRIFPSDVNGAMSSMLDAFSGPRFESLTLDAADARAWRALEGRFDVIVCHGALRYFHQRLGAAAVAGWVRALRRGGTLLVSDVCTRSFDVPAVFSRLVGLFGDTGALARLRAAETRVFEMSRFYELAAGLDCLPDATQLAALRARAGFRDERVFVLEVRRPARRR